MVKIARKRRGITTQWAVSNLGKALVMAVIYFLVISIQNNIHSLVDESNSSLLLSSSSERKVTYRTPLAYGTKDLTKNTAKLVKQAIQNGFRHIVTAGHHRSHNETAVGIGWRESGVDRNELFLQTCFIPLSEKHRDFQKQTSDPNDLPNAIEDQVRLSIQTSLSNLQTKHIDALLFNNPIDKLWDANEIEKAWKVMESYVDEGIVGQLGLTSVHDMNKEWFETFYSNARVKPTIIQNRFHANRKYDVTMQETFAKHNIWVQRFWLLNGSSGGGTKNNYMAQKKGVSAPQLMLAFVMSMGSETCLVGTKSLQHMQDDVEIAKCYSSLFVDDQERQDYAKILGMKQPSNQPLPGKGGIDYANSKISQCQSTTKM